MGLRYVASLSLGPCFSNISVDSVKKRLGTWPGFIFKGRVQKPDVSARPGTRRDDVKEMAPTVSDR